MAGRLLACTVGGVAEPEPDVAAAAITTCSLRHSSWSANESLRKRRHQEKVGCVGGVGVFGGQEGKMYDGRTRADGVGEDWEGRKRVGCGQTR